MTNETYIERINQFVVEYLEDLPAQHKAEMRLNGMDPNNNWQLKWSFETYDAAVNQCRQDRANHKKICEQFNCDVTTMFRIRDLGAPMEIVRPVMF